MNKWVRVWRVVIIQHMVTLFIHIIVVALLLCSFFPLCHPGCLCWENWEVETNQKKSMNFKWLQRVKTSLLGVNTRTRTHARVRAHMHTCAFPPARKGRVRTPSWWQLLGTLQFPMVAGPWCVALPGRGPYLLALSRK